MFAWWNEVKIIRSNLTQYLTQYTMFSFFKSKSEPEAPNTAAPAPEPQASWGERLLRGLSKTRDVLNTPVSELLSGGAKIDAALYEELETILLFELEIKIHWINQCLHQ